MSQSNLFVSSELSSSNSRLRRCSVFSQRVTAGSSTPSTIENNLLDSRFAHVILLLENKHYTTGVCFIAVNDMTVLVKASTPAQTGAR